MKKKQAKPKSRKNEILRPDLIDSQIKLFQYCNNLQSKLHDAELHMNAMHFQMSILKRENQEIKSLLQGLSNHMQSLRDLRRGEEGEEVEPQEEREQTPQPPQRKSLPLHDDVTMNCDVCGHNHHVNNKTCPKCNFNRTKKDR
jgi:hypothetical protein